MIKDYHNSVNAIKIDKDQERVYEYLKSKTFEELDLRQIDVLVDRYVMGGVPSVNIHSKTVTSDRFPLNYTTNEKDAWLVAKKFGIAVIPQSSDTGFNWYATDINRISYRGDEIAIVGKEDTGYSAKTMPIAVCLSALLSVGIDLSGE